MATKTTTKPPTPPPVTAAPREGEPPVEGPPEQPPVEPPPEGTTHDAVSAGGECSLCHWKPGDLEPHEVAIMPENVAQPAEGTVAPPEPPPPPAPDPLACAAIPMQAECPKCHWSIDSSDPAVRATPHPTY